MNSAPETTPNSSLKFWQIWFSFTGRISAMEFWLKGFTPGILLGIAVVRLDAELDARGLVIYPYLTFSLWPLAATLTKRWNDWSRSRDTQLVQNG